jgi:hypothetical protein
MTIAQIKTLAYTQLRKVDAPDQELFIQYVNRINQNDYDLLCSLDPESYLSTATAISSNPQALSATFDHMRVLNCNVYQVDSDDNITRKIPQSSFGSLETGWYLDGTNIVLTPSDVDYDDWYYRYIPELADITADTDSIILPDKYSMKMVYELAALDAIENDESSDIVRRFQEMANGVEKDLRKDYNREPSRLNLGTYINANRYLNFPNKLR